MSAASFRFTNRLASEQSPYLRQHAHNPVDWYPWGDEAFARARAEDKPIFLSVGYSTCHWCHVMAHESFENAAIAERLNRDFVPVKVDREERPDVDRVYMTFVQAMTGQGGWPMSVWLTPDRKPFFGGTYFPPEDRSGRPGFAAILEALAKAWVGNRERIEEESERVVGALRQLALGQSSKPQGPDSRETPSGNPKSQTPAPREPVSTQNPRLKTQIQDAEAAAAAAGSCLEQLAAGFDQEHGGFGGAPKFPRAAVFEFLLRTAAADDRAGAEAVRMVALTLRRMAEGGIHDHVGGGFHRYSVDAEWFVPHFEKMLYDQAQLAVCYLEAAQATGDAWPAGIARDILDYVLRDLAHPAGGFYSAEDADSFRSVEGRGSRDERPAPSAKGKAQGVGGGAATGGGHAAEGAFYVWTKREIEETLKEGAAHAGPSTAGINPAPPSSQSPDLRWGGLHARQPYDSGLRDPAGISPAPPPPNGPGQAPPATTLDSGRANSPSPDDVEFFCAHFDVREGGNVPAELDPHGDLRGRNILRQRQPLAETARKFGLDSEAAEKRLQACLAPLRDARSRRPRPSLDDKIITAWNGLMISALAKAHQVLEVGGRSGERQPVVYLDAATRTAEFLRRELYDEATAALYRSFRGGRSGIPGFAEDYACLIQGLLDLYEASFEIRWLQWAERLQARMDELFWDTDGGGYFSSRADAAGIIVRLKEDYDGAEPAPASVAVSNLLRLDAMIGAASGDGPDYRSRALQCAESLRGQWAQAPLALPLLLAALGSAGRPPRTVVLAGDPSADDFRALAAVLHERRRPRFALLAADGGEGRRWLAARRPEIGAMRPVGGRTAAYVCEDFTCQAPVTEPEALRRMIGPS